MSGATEDAALPAVRSVRVERSGGLAGLKASGERAGDSLTGPQREAVHKVLQNAAAPTASGTAGGVARGGADRFGYRVRVVHDDGSERSIDVFEDDMPKVLAAIAKSELP